VRAAEQPAQSSPAAQIHISVVERDSGSAPSGSSSQKGFTVLVADSTGAPVSESAVVFRLPDEGPTGSFADSSHSAIVYTSASGLAQISGIKWSDNPGQVGIKVTATKGDARAGMLLLETLTSKAAPPPAVIAPANATPIGEKSGTLVTPAAQGSAAVPQLGRASGQEKPALPRSVEPSQQLAVSPAVSVSNSKTADTGSHTSHKKWIIIAAVVAAAAGAGVAVGAKGKSSSKTSTSGVVVGTPTVSVGQP
jgi:hypothetical protein